MQSFLTVQDTYPLMPGNDVGPGPVYPELLLVTSNFNDDYWVRSTLNLTPNADTGSTGGLGAAYKLIPAGGDSNIYHDTNLPLSAGASYRLLAIAKKAEARYFRMTMFAQPNGIVLNTVFDLQAGTSNAGSNTLITPVGNGYFALATTFTIAQAVATAQLYMSPGKDDGSDAPYVVSTAGNGLFLERVSLKQTA